MKTLALILLAVFSTALTQAETRYAQSVGSCYASYICSGAFIGNFPDADACFAAGGLSYEDVAGAGCDNNY